MLTSDADRREGACRGVGITDKDRLAWCRDAEVAPDQVVDALFAFTEEREVAYYNEHLVPLSARNAARIDRAEYTPVEFADELPEQGASLRPLREDELAALDYIGRRFVIDGTLTMPPTDVPHDEEMQWPPRPPHWLVWIPNRSGRGEHSIEVEPLSGTFILSDEWLLSHELENSCQRYGIVPCRGRFFIRFDVVRPQRLMMPNEGGGTGPGPLEILRLLEAVELWPVDIKDTAEP